MTKLKDRISSELKSGILNYWCTTALDEEFGGFHDTISNSNVVKVGEDKGLIQNARNLWSFSRAYNHFGDEQYLHMAKRARDFLLNKLWDIEFGGFFWTVSVDGKPVKDHKQVYGQAFAIYALSEYFIATEDEISLSYAHRTFDLLEEKTLDKLNNGYLEAFSREWEMMEDVRLSPVDLNEKKSNNTHLHVMEAYTTYYKVTRNIRVKNALQNSIELMINRIMDQESRNFTLFFNETWDKRSDIVSYGHEIEAAWLIHEALLALEDKYFLEESVPHILGIVENSLSYLDGDFGEMGMFNEEDGNGEIDKDKIWWVQAEACVGFTLAYQLTGEKRYLRIVENIWNFIEEYVVDKSGEWFWYAKDSGTKKTDDFKVQNWKSLYHNSRACIELLERL